jgi:hypothetical protein
MRSLLLITLLAALTPCMNAQRMAPASPHFARSYQRDGHARSFFGPLAFYDPFYSDYLSSTGYPVASQPPVIVVQTPPAAAFVPERPSPPRQPLTIELQGERYVRLSGEETSEAETIDSMPAAPRRRPERAVPAAIEPAAATELAPAVLVFRDGHREEVSDYTITDGILYTRGEPYSGTWSRKVDLSSLDLRETVKSNQLRGAKFRLPSSPNEVIVRP